MAQKERRGQRRVQPVASSCPDLTFNFCEAQQPRTKIYTSLDKQQSLYNMLISQTKRHTHTHRLKKNLVKKAPKLVLAAAGQGFTVSHRCDL